MAWIIDEAYVVPQLLTLTDTVQNTELGREVRGHDNGTTNNQGAGTFIYLKNGGGATIVVGSLVTYDNVALTATLAPATGGAGQVAVSMAIAASGAFFWAQIQGVAAVKAPNAMVVGADVFMLAATAGSVDDAQVNGEQVVNCKAVSTTGVPSTGLALIQINRPFLQGQIV